MPKFTFRIQLRDALDDEAADRLYEGFDEEIGIEAGPKGTFIEFDRDAASFLDAALDAVTDVIRLGYEPLAVEDELVSMADIADRTGRSRQSVSMLVNGQRGPGSFPRAAAGNVRSPLWHWADVAVWFEGTEEGGADIGDRIRTIASINGALANRVLNRNHPHDVEQIQQRLAG
jgi:hypothetical protein